MIKIMILSGYREGPESLADMTPQDLMVLAKEGWRWTVDWSAVPAENRFEWARMDMVMKIISAVMRGALITLSLPDHDDQTWRGVTLDDVGVIEDAIVYSGYTVAVSRDDEDLLVISGTSSELSLQ